MFGNEKLCPEKLGAMSSIFFYPSVENASGASAQKMATESEPGF